jgi:hypothetical protein
MNLAGGAQGDSGHAQGAHGDYLIRLGRRKEFSCLAVRRSDHNGDCEWTGEDGGRVEGVGD